MNYQKEMTKIAEDLAELLKLPHMQGELEWRLATETLAEQAAACMQDYGDLQC